MTSQSSRRSPTPSECLVFSLEAFILAGFQFGRLPLLLSFSPDVFAPLGKPSKHPLPCLPSSPCQKPPLAGFQGPWFGCSCRDNDSCKGEQSASQQGHLLYICRLHTRDSHLEKAGASACFAIVFIWTGKIFHTAIRNSAVGICSSVDSTGASSDPVICC